MMNAAAGIFLAARRKLTAKSYVQDGLIAMWDGIENAGWGVHDANATTWKDLVGSDDLIFSAAPQVGDLGFTIPHYSYAASQTARTMSNYTIEICAVFSYNGNFTDLFSFQSKNESDSLNGIPFIILPTTNPNLFPPLGVLSTGNGCYAVSVISGTSGQCYQNGVFRGATTVQANNAVYVIANSLRTRTINSYARLFRAIRLYNRALSADEVAANYAVDKARFNLP